MNINEEKHSQWQALKGMGFKAYWDYYWDYYKIHTAVVIGVIIMASIFIHDIVSAKPYAMEAIFVNANTMQDMDDLQNSFAESEGIDLSKEQVYIDAMTTLSLSGDDGYAMATMEKIFAQVAAKEIDVFLADPEVYENYARKGMYTDLREIFTPEELSSLQDHIYYATPEGETEEIPCGIYLENNSILQANDCYSLVTPIAGVVVSSERQDTAANFLRYLLNN